MKKSGARLEGDESPAFNHYLEYTVRVRGTLNLWGSSGILTNTIYPSPPLLHIRNDKHGEIVTFGTQTAAVAQTPGGAPATAAAQTTIGTLKPGEGYSILIQGISGVFATCATGLESSVYCVITNH